MSTENFKSVSWGQLMVSTETEIGQRRALPPDIETHIKALTAPDAEPLPPDTQHWVKAKFREYAAGRQRLDEVMNLAPVSAKRDWRTIDRMGVRNTWLVNAFELIEGVSVYSRCVELGERISNFEEVFWPRLEDCTTLPEEMTPFRRALFFAFRFGEGAMPRYWKTLMNIVEKPPIGLETCSILWHIHADVYDQSRSSTAIRHSNYLGNLHMNIIGKLAVLTLHAWESSPEVRARHQDDLTDYHQRILRQTMDCDVDESEIPALITDVLSPEQIANALQLAGVKSL